jgi:hypothetical protein
MQKLLSKYDTSQADIIRRALAWMAIMETTTEKTPLDNILTYVDRLSNNEHIILDIAHWRLVLNELNGGSKQFLAEVYKSGEHHRSEYSEMGLRDIRQVLKFIEKTNWYNLNEESPSSFTLVLTVPESTKFIKAFFEGFFSKYPQHVDIVEEDMKLRFKVSSN